MTNKQTVDPLLDIVDAVVKLVAQEETALFYGWAYDEKSTIVFWNEEHGGDWRNFVACAKASGARMLELGSIRRVSD